MRLVGPDEFWRYMQRPGFIRLSPLTGVLAGRFLCTTEMPERVGCMDTAIARLIVLCSPVTGFKGALGQMIGYARGRLG